MSRNCCVERLIMTQRKKLEHNKRDLLLDAVKDTVDREQLRWLRRTKREWGRVRGKRSSLSSVAVERADALELPGTNSSGSRILFLAIPIFQKEPFITPLAKYNKKADGELRGESKCYNMSLNDLPGLLREEYLPHLWVQYHSCVFRNCPLYFIFLLFCHLVPSYFFFFALDFWK